MDDVSRIILPNFQIPPDSRDLIFRPISKGKDSCKLIAPDKPISYSTMRQAFRWDLKTIGFSDAVLLFVVEWRQIMLFLTSELANKAEITILSARDTTRAWVPGRASRVGMYGYIRPGITRGCHLGFKTNRVLSSRFV